MSYKILHIEDDDFLRLAARELLEARLSFPHEMQEQVRAENLLTVGKDEFQLIISDNDTKSEKYGVDAALEARQNGLKTPIILYSSFGGVPQRKLDTAQRMNIIPIYKGSFGVLISEIERLHMLEVQTSTTNVSDNTTCRLDKSEPLDYQI